MNFHVARRSEHKINQIASCTVTYVTKITTVTDTYTVRYSLVSSSSTGPTLLLSFEASLCAVIESYTAVYESFFMT